MVDTFWVVHGVGRPCCDDLDPCYWSERPHYLSNEENAVERRWIELVQQQRLSKVNRQSSGKYSLVRIAIMEEEEHYQVENASFRYELM